MHIQVMGSYEDHRPQDRCREICARRGIPYLDLLPAFRTARHASEEGLFYDHCHPTPHVSTIVAREILAGLDREKLIPK